MKNMEPRRAPQPVSAWHPQSTQDHRCEEVAYGYPRSSHAGIPDTSEMLYLGGDTWVRKGLLKTSVGDPVPLPGQVRRGPADPNAAPRVNLGISGDAHRSSSALGKMAFDMKVDYAVKQIRGFLGATSTPAQPQQSLQPLRRTLSTTIFVE